MTYKSPVWIAKAMDLARDLQQTPFKAIGDELEKRLRQDQHDLFHDGEFHDGCEHCDEEREKYG